MARQHSITEERNLDWRKADAELAAEHRVHKNTITKARKRLGKPKAVKHGRWCKETAWEKLQGLDTRGLSARRIAERVGCTLGTAYTYRSALRKSERPPSQETHGQIHGSYNTRAYEIWLEDEKGERRQLYRGGNSPNSAQGYLKSGQGVGANTMRDLCRQVALEYAEEHGAGFNRVRYQRVTAMLGEALMYDLDNPEKRATYESVPAWQSTG